jgi:sortase (surface protein transpeptidase)
LGRLPKIKNEDIIQIKLSNGEHRNFKVIYTYTVTSDQTHILGQTEDARITIYTCTGFLDFKRFVVVAIPTN